MPLESEKLAKKIRLHALEMTSLGGSSHIGSILSIADILAVLYENILVFDAKKPNLKTRDDFKKIFVPNSYLGDILIEGFIKAGWEPEN